MIDKKIFSTRFRILIDNAGLKMTDIARALDLTKQSVDAWDKQKAVPSADKLVELAEVLDCSIDYLCGLSDDPSRIKRM